MRLQNPWHHGNSHPLTGCPQQTSSGAHRSDWRQGENPKKVFLMAQASENQPAATVGKAWALPRSVYPTLQNKNIKLAGKSNKEYWLWIVVKTHCSWERKQKRPSIPGWRAGIYPGPKPRGPLQLKEGKDHGKVLCSKSQGHSTYPSLHQNNREHPLPSHQPAAINC